MSNCARWASTSESERVVEVTAARLERWCATFGERHGGPVQARREDDALVLSAADGARAVLRPGFDWPEGLATLPDALEWVTRPRRCAVLLVRRGGYACAVVDTALAGQTAVLASKVGTRYVQSRTAAGGWSQQRFARRRENQARDLTRAVADVAARVLLPGAAQWLVTGGDRPLVAAVLSDARLRPLTVLPSGRHLPLGDPRAADVRRLGDLLGSVRITVAEPAMD